MLNELGRRVLTAANQPGQLRWCDRRNAAFLTDAAGSTLEVTDTVRQLGRDQLLCLDGDQLATTAAGERALTGGLA